MKIMMVITGMRSGGAERVMATLCNELSARHDVLLLSLKEAVSDYYLDESVDFVGGNITNKNVIKSILFIKKQIEKWHPDLILSFMTKSNIVALSAKILSKAKVPFVIAERTNPYQTPAVFRFIRKYLYPMADGCVFQTKQAKEYYDGILRCESVIIKNPLNPDFSIKPYTGIRKKKIVTAGRLSEEKNQKLLIDAFSKIADRYPDYCVEIYGDGHLKEELTNHIASCGMENRIKLMGRKKHIEDHIRDTEIFVLPSNSEGMPNALIEAAALGLACIATDCPIGGSAEIIQNEFNGLLVPMNQPDVMAEALERLIEEKEFADYLRTNAVKITEEFNAQHICNLWEQYLMRVAEK